MPDQSNFTALWARAVVEYERETERKINKNHTFHGLRSLDDLEKAIKDRKEGFSNFRNERRPLYSSLAKCIAPIEPILQIIQKGIGGTPFQPFSAVLVAASYLLQACGSVRKAYDGLEELFDQISNVTIRLREYNFRSLETSLRTKMTDILAYLLEIIGKVEACIKRKRVKQWVRSVLLQDDGIASVVTKLRQYIETEVRLVTALTYRGVKELQTMITDVHANGQAMKADVCNVLSNQQSDGQKPFNGRNEAKLLDLLRTSTMDANSQEHAANVEKLTKGTGFWIRDEPNFQSWEHETDPILWVLGKPGVGKTMLAARTIETLQHKYLQNPDKPGPSYTSVGYLYFKDDDPALQDCIQMLKTAVLQIAKVDDQFKDYAMALIDANEDAFASARRIWKQLFLEFFTEARSPRSPEHRALLVVDGLDEAPEKERAKFWFCLKDLMALNKGGYKCHLKIAVFARPEVCADSGYQELVLQRQPLTVEITPEKSSSDIAAFIWNRLSDVPVLRTLKKHKALRECQTLARDIYESVQSRSQDFLWASLVLDAVLKSPSPEAVRRSLREAPEGLDEMLHHVFKRLNVGPPMHGIYLSKLISWVLCVHRPLSIAELFVLLFVSTDQHCYMIENHLQSRYSSIFEVNGPQAGFEREFGQAGTSTADGDSKSDDFIFLDETATEHEHEATRDGLEYLIDDLDDSQPIENKSIRLQQEGDKARFQIPTHWYQTTVTFSHARIRDYLTTEGDLSTRRWKDCSMVLENLNGARVQNLLAYFHILRTDIADWYRVWFLKTYTRTH